VIFDRETKKLVSYRIKMTYFTCKFIKNVGIGDQLYQLQTLYNLGKTIGLQYIHSPLPPSRWCYQLDISKFLGLEIGEETLEFYKNYKIIDIDAYTVANCFVLGKSLASVLKASSTLKIIYRLVFSEKLYLENPCYVEMPSIFKFDFRKKFLEAQKKSLNIYNPFKENLISVAVHVRRGDCTWIEDDGKYFFPYMNKIIDANPNDVDVCRAVPTQEYLKLIEIILKKYNPNLFEIKIYSDGIPDRFWMEHNTFQKIKYWLVNSRLGFLLNRNHKITKYNDIIFSENLKKRFYELKNEFDIYNQYPNITMRIGQDVELTKEVITAFGMADISIVARDNSFPEIGLHSSDTYRILMNVRTDQSNNIALIKDLLINRREIA
jgi:hypothetical protein